MRRTRAATDEARPSGRRPAARRAAHVQCRGRWDHDRRLRHTHDHRDGNPPARRVRRPLARRRRIHAGMQAAVGRPRARHGRDSYRTAAHCSSRARDLRLDRTHAVRASPMVRLLTLAFVVLPVLLGLWIYVSTRDWPHLRRQYELGHTPTWPPRAEAGGKPEVLDTAQHTVA